MGRLLCGWGRWRTFLGNFFGTLLGTFLRTFLGIFLACSLLSSGFLRGLDGHTGIGFSPQA